MNHTQTISRSRPPVTAQVTTKGGCKNLPHADHARECKVAVKKGGDYIPPCSR